MTNILISTLKHTYLYFIADIKQMKKLGYRVLEFGRFHWEDVKDALETYKAHHGNLNIPYEYVID